MKPTPANISLGFTEEPFPVGSHVCQIYQDEDERQDSLLRFLLAGLQAGERTCCFSDKATEPALADFLGQHGLPYAQAKSSGALTLAATREVYFQDGRFDPERMLQLLAQYHQDSVQQSYPAARVIGEMNPAVQQTPGGDRLLEYESRVSLLLREHPVTAVCQYDARAFDGAAIMDILKVHPLMVVRGSVVQNPFYIQPEEYLAR